MLIFGSESNTMTLELERGTVAGITAFYSIVESVNWFEEANETRSSAVLLEHSEQSGSRPSC
jgi:hypothetical protein